MTFWQYSAKFVLFQFMWGVMTSSWLWGTRRCMDQLEVGPFGCRYVVVSNLVPLLLVCTRRDATRHLSSLHLAQSNSATSLESFHFVELNRWLSCRGSWLEGSLGGILINVSDLPCFPNHLSLIQLYGCWMWGYVRCSSYSWEPSLADSSFFKLSTSFFSYISRLEPPLSYQKEIHVEFVIRRSEAEPELEPTGIPSAWLQIPFCRCIGSRVYCALSHFSASDLERLQIGYLWTVIRLSLLLKAPASGTWAALVDVNGCMVSYTSNFLFDSSTLKFTEVKITGSGILAICA